jgi:hypothetical protein
VCPAGSTPVYRAYNSGFRLGIDSNHRITADRAAIQQVVARGWLDEGVVMCAPTPQGPPAGSGSNPAADFCAPNRDAD